MRKTILKQFPFCPAAVIQVTGEDAFGFLQGQFTNDLKIGVDHVTYGLWLNQKGRVLADSYVFREAEHEFLVVSHSSAAVIIKERLEQYIVADDVSVADWTQEWAGVILWGEKCADFVQQEMGAAVSPRRFARHAGLWFFSGRRAGDASIEIIGPLAAVEHCREKLRASGCLEAMEAELEWTRIVAGVPAIPLDIGPADLPNEAGLEAVAISFTKGCYLGQEVMARLKNLGQVRRQLRKLRGPGAPPKPGALLYQGAKKVGEIRSVASGSEGFVALGLVTLTGLDAQAGFRFAPAGEAGKEDQVWLS